MNKTHQFKTEAEAHQVITANVWMGAGWLKLTEDKFAQLVA